MTSTAAPGAAERARRKAAALDALKKADRRYQRNQARALADAADRRACARAARIEGAQWTEVGEVLGVTPEQALRLGTDADAD